VNWLSTIGLKARGWDPAHRPNTRLTKTSSVALTYVVNVIEDVRQRDQALIDAWSYTSGVLIVSARLTDERNESHTRPMADGWVTSRGTFQRFYDHNELGQWIGEVLNVEPVPAGPGIFYVFRTTSERESFLARRYAMRMPTPAYRRSDKSFVENRQVLEELIEFFALHGRLPIESELENVNSIKEAFGSIGRAFRVVETVTDRDEWLNLATRRRIDLLVYLSLKLLDGPYRMADLAPSTQRDVRAHFRSLANASATAERLLFGVGDLKNIGLACRSSLVGKLTPSALYVHKDAYSFLPAILKVYEGCARRLVGDVPGANVIKLHRDSKKVSYLSYPEFDLDPHPALSRSDVVDLAEQSYAVRRYKEGVNLPILHRKEEFIHRSDPRWDLFRSTTAAEESAGLFENPSTIGYRDQWDELLAKNGLEFVDHALTPVVSTY
jgi:DNA phosphorothioation-associated putative methyltransferase